MTSINLSSFDPALKQYYKDSNVKKTTYKHRPMYGLMPKFESFAGRNMPIVNVFGNPQGRSAGFTEAQANRTSAKLEDFLLTRVKDYSIATVDGETLDASATDKGAFLKALTVQIDGAMDALADAIESFLPRSGTGSIGQVDSGATVASGTIELESITDISNFEVGMTLRGTSTDGGAYDTGEEVVAGVDRTAGSLDSTSTNWDDNLTALATGDFLLVSGDLNAKISGFDAWFPDTAPSSSAFFGVDRTQDSRLFGSIHDGTSQSIEDALIDGASKASQEGAYVDCAFVHHVQYRALIRALGSKKEYTSLQAESTKGRPADVGYRGVTVYGDHGEMPVFAANKVQGATAWILEKESCLLSTLGPATHILNYDGNKVLRQAAADGVEVRIGFRGNFSSKAPNHNTNVSLAAA